MSTDTLVKSGSSRSFPAAQLEATLRQELLNIAISTAAMQAITLPPTTPAKYTAAIQLDSLDVVDALLSVEPLVGFKLKDHIVQAGGYASINAAMDHLMPRIKSAWERRASKGGKK
jgi:hypothetical protein